MLIQADLVSIQAKQFAIDSFIFLHEIIPRGRKKSNVLCKNSTSIKACFVILDWGEPEASSQFNHISSAGLPGEGDWVLLGLGMFPLALGAFGVLRLRSPDFPQGISSPAGSKGSRVVRAEEAQIYLHHLRLILTTRSGVLQVGRLRKARIEKAIQKFFQARLSCPRSQSSQVISEEFTCLKSSLGDSHKRLILEAGISAASACLTQYLYQRNVCQINALP